MNMNDLLESLYERENTNQTLEKTAEATLLSALSNSNKEDNPFLNFDMDTLVKMAQSLDEVDSEFTTNQSPEALQEASLDKLGGEQMAHACVHEFGLMKEAMMNGLCRVCKTNTFDVEGSTVCSHCLGE
tara:strand:- start:10 stop:396 length:387 start_codon:yes stop_codon:yes gene_type:complete